MPAPQRQLRAMLARLAPVLVPGDVVFCPIPDRSGIAAALPHARAIIHEAEGLTAVLPVETARLQGHDISLRMRQITLTVHSALDGVGLTAAVSGALAAAGIPCNVVAGVHHDHLFVPARRAAAALRVLKRAGASHDGNRRRMPMTPPSRRPKA
jgi:hypothetical protein